MPLSDVKHQPHAHRLIQQAIGRQRVPHAYIFHGPGGVGRAMMARGLAELLLCERPTEQRLAGDGVDKAGAESFRSGCGRCEDCRAVDADVHPDLHRIHRHLHREHPDADVRQRKGLDLGVDVLRHFVIDRVGLTPARGRAKVFIIEEADRMNPQAQNAVLKTLEEPPGPTFLILLVTALDRLLPTTRSRCQLVRFDALPSAFVVAKVAEQCPALPAEQVTWYAQVGAGSIGDAVRAAGDELYELNQRVLDGFASLAAESDRFDVAKTWTEEAKELGERYRKHDSEISDAEATRRALKTIFQLAAVWYADLLRTGSGQSPVIVNLGAAARIQQAADRVDAEQAAEAIKRIAAAERQLDLNVNTQLCVECLVNDLHQFGGCPTSLEVGER